MRRRLKRRRILTWGAVLVSTLVAAALYPAALFGLRVLKMDDVNLLKQLYRPVE